MQKSIWIILLFAALSSLATRRKYATTRTRDLIYTRHDGVALTMDVIQRR
jgi:hypothetical protein